MPEHALWTAAWMELLLRSHRSLLGRELTREARAGADPACWLYEEAPFCLLAHDGGADPRFVYANRSAQRCFEYSWEELVGLPSRLSAAADARNERAQLLASVAQRGFTEGYRGLRVAKSGRRFWIEDVSVWNLVDERGGSHGQAATYRRTTPA
jgi:PAS domain S-box-containing protein